MTFENNWPQREISPRGMSTFDDLIRTRMYAFIECSGLIKIITHLNRSSHRKTTSGTNWSNRWTYRVLFITSPRREAIVHREAQPRSARNVRRTHARAPHFFASTRASLSLRGATTQQRTAIRKKKAFSGVLSTEGRVVGLCWAKYKPKGPKGPPECDRPQASTQARRAVGFTSASERTVHNLNRSRNLYLKAKASI